MEKGEGEEMSVLDCCGASITGTWDNFDSANAVADWIEEMLKKADMPVELCCEGHFTDRKADLMEQLEEARRKVNEARLICQLVLEQI